MDRIPGADHRVLPTGTGGAARQTLRIIAVALAVGLLLGAVPLRQWTEGQGAPALVRAAAAWEGAAGQAGLNGPYATIRTAFRRIDGAR